MLRAAVLFVLVGAVAVEAMDWEPLHGLNVKKWLRGGTDPRPDGSITLSLQCSVDRMNAVERHARTWDGPIALAVLVNDQSAESTVAAQYDAFSDITKRHVDLHIVRPFEPLNSFPINQMRNIALEEVHTEWVYEMDIDEDTVFTMHDYLGVLTASLGSANADRTVFAVPSFEWAGKDHPSIPKSKSELNSFFDNGVVVMKHSFYPKAYQGALDVYTWFGADSPLNVPFRDSYEPYFIVRTNMRVRFDDAFVGFGSNKAQLTTQMAASGKRFVVLPNVFNFADECAEVYRAEYNNRNSEASAETARQFWQKLGEEHGCYECTRTDCVVNCPGMFSEANPAASLVQGAIDVATQPSQPVAQVPNPIEVATSTASAAQANSALEPPASAPKAVQGALTPAM